MASPPTAPQKLFGWFGGYGLAGTGGFFESMGFRPGRFFAAAAGAGELAGGLLIAFGLGGPIGPMLVIAVMTVAILTVHISHGFFAGENGVEVPLLYATLAVFFAFAGYGAYSLDDALGWTVVWTPALIGHPRTRAPGRPAQPRRAPQAGGAAHRLA